MVFSRLASINVTNPEDLLFLVGAVLVAKVSITWAVMVLKAIYAHFLRPRKNLRKFGEWAVVTGASDGIGKNYAIEFAKSKMNVVLIARRVDLLKELASELESKNGVQTKVVQADLCSQEGLDAVEKEIKGLDIGVLVNNAGLSYEYPDSLDQVPQSRIDSLIKLNITALTMMCKMVIDGMIERKRGSIVNVSSISGVTPMGLLSVYSASKSYVNYLSQALNQEYASKGICVQSVVPLFVASAMSKQRPSLTCPKASVYAKAAVDKIGYESYTYGFYIHSIIGWVLDALPNGTVTTQLYNMHKSIRKRAIRKKERLAAEAAKAK